MTAKTKAAPVVHEGAQQRQLGPGVFRGECPCGWAGPVREDVRWKARAAALADADAHAGRPPRSGPKGPTPSRPVRIADELWLPVVAVAEAEGITASEVLRQAIAADPRVAAKLAAVSA